MEFVIPSTADFDRFSELVDQVLLLRKREKLKASPQVSRGAVGKWMYGLIGFVVG